MPDLVADASEWLERHSQGIQTHSDICHRWHDACLVSRLIREIEITRGYRDEAESEASIAALVVEKLQSLTRFQDRVIRSGNTASLATTEVTSLKEAIEEFESRDNIVSQQIAQNLRGLLERLSPN